METPIATDKYLAKPGEKINLEKYESSYHGNLEKMGVQLQFEEFKLGIAALQEKLYASASASLLIIFQAMDAAGKDGTISHVMSGVNPQGCDIHSFKAPSEIENRHDFLWRHACAMPERGMIGIHNRSHYENVLICKVHPELVLNENRVGIKSVSDLRSTFWKDRYESIRNFESHLANNGTVILKFFLHVSQEEQRERLLKRIERPEKNWKFNAQDTAESLLWKNYQSVYESAIEATSTPEAPWYIIPADKKWYTRLLVSKLIYETLKKMNPKFPTLSNAQRDRMEATRIALSSYK